MTADKLSDVRNGVLGRRCAILGAMSALPRKQTFLDTIGMSAVPPIATKLMRRNEVTLVPLADICSAANPHCYSITSPTRASRVGGISNPNAMAVSRMMAKTNFVGSSPALLASETRSVVGTGARRMVLGIGAAERFITES